MVSNFQRQMMDWCWVVVSDVGSRVIYKSMRSCFVCSGSRWCKYYVVVITNTCKAWAQQNCQQPRMLTVSWLNLKQSAIILTTCPWSNWLVWGQRLFYVQCMGLCCFMIRPLLKYVYLYMTCLIWTTSIYLYVCNYLNSKGHQWQLDSEYWGMTIHLWVMVVWVFLSGDKLLTGHPRTSI